MSLVTGFYRESGADGTGAGTKDLTSVGQRITEENDEDTGSAINTLVKREKWNDTEKRAVEEFFLKALQNS